MRLVSVEGENTEIEVYILSKIIRSISECNKYYLALVDLVVTINYEG